MKCVINEINVEPFFNKFYSVTMFLLILINMLPCLHTCSDSKKYYATFAARAETNLCINCVKKIAHIYNCEKLFAYSMSYQNYKT